MLVVLWFHASCLVSSSPYLGTFPPLLSDEDTAGLTDGAKQVQGDCETGQGDKGKHQGFRTDTREDVEGFPRGHLQELGARRNRNFWG